MPDLSDKVSEPCPWCGSTPQFKFREPGGRDGAYELPLRAFGCTNKGCPVQPHTRWENIGYFVAEKHSDVRDDEAGLSHIAAWNRRTRSPASSMEGWRTMDSAPKDGTRVILDWGGAARVGYYLDNSTKYASWQGWKVPSMEEWPKGQPERWMPFPSLAASPIPPEVMK